MSDDSDAKNKSDKGKLGAGATMQIDLDQVQLVDLEAARSPAPSAASPASRKTPPPLPEGMPAPTMGSGAPGAASTPPVAPAAAMGEPPKKLAMHIGVIVLVVGVAVGAGLWVAHAVGGSTATTAPSAAVPSATHTAPVDSVLTLPPIEVR